VNTARAVDVAVIGDGPAGSALALGCQRAGLDVVLVGDDAPWSATYSSWVDDLRPVGDLLDVDSVISMTSSQVWAYGTRAHRLDREYATLDNGALRSALRDGVTHRSARVERVDECPLGGPGHLLVLDDGDVVRARVVFDATGWPARFARRTRGRAPAWQTALGVVLADPPDGELGRPTFMDFRGVIGTDGEPSTVGPSGVTTFCYSLPVHDGWLVEETVLAARPAIEPIALVARLAGRLGRHPDSLLAESVRTEYVRIPLGGSRPLPKQPIVAFGSAAGYVHPATGFSVAASIRAVSRVVTAVGAALAASPGGVVDAAPITEAVWPISLRRSQVLHEYGLGVLLDLDEDEVRSFFDAFFDLGVGDWSSYLRLDAPPGEISAVMARLFRSSSWQLRRRLAGRNPAALARVVRP
jgi:lycopene beta-cyclase